MNADDRETVTPIERADRIPFEVFQPDRHSLGVYKGKAMPEDSAADAAALMGRKQIEFTEAHAVREAHQRNRADVPAAPHDPGERLLGEPVVVQPQLQAFVPSPAGAGSGAPIYRHYRHFRQRTW